MVLPLQFIGKLTHKSSGVTALCTVYLDSNSVRLAAGFMDGPVVVWDPFPPKAKDPAPTVTMAPSVVSKGHEGDVMGMSVVPGMTESGLGKLFTVGGQNHGLNLCCCSGTLSIVAMFWLCTDLPNERVKQPLF